MKKCVILWLVGFLSVWKAFSHRMCLNYESPLYMDETFDLCRDFEKFGCCTKQQDGQIKQRYQAIMKKLSENLRSNCSEIIKDLLCQECSEYSAHQYDLEKSGKINDLPGLCGRYCVGIFGKCRQAIIHLTNDAKLLNLLREGDGNGFCDAVKLDDLYYCYPLKDEYAQGYLEFYQPPKQKPCSNLCVEEVANRIYSPTSIRHAGDGTHRLFVVEQRGIVWAFMPNMSKIHPPFLNITSQVACQMRGFDERGLLDIQFHPEYKVNGLFYVHYTSVRGTSDVIRVSEMRICADDMNRADPDYERILLEVENPFHNHNGGQLLFGSDGYMYITLGDGGGNGDPYSNGQNRSTLLGKMLRIDPSSPSNGNPYSIPNDNPFVSDPTSRSEIYAYGLRNAWRCSFDSKGRLICADVGQNTYEEIDIIKSGGNYGWKAFEGEKCYDEAMCRNTSLRDEHIPPIFSYNSSFGRSITGGFVYRGCQHSKLKGNYIYGDFMSGRMAMLRENKKGKWIHRNVCMSKKLCTRFGKQHKYPRYIQTFGEDESGELYFSAVSDPRPGSRSGRIYKLTQAYPTTCASRCSHPIESPTVLSSRAEIQNYRPLPDREVQIRLVGSGQTRIATKGRIEVRPKGGTWSTVCGKTFTIEAAHVICRMNGFPRAREFSVGEFGPGTGKIRFGTLQCTGNEDHLDECNHSGWNTARACRHRHDASVWCESFTFAGTLV